MQHIGGVALLAGAFATLTAPAFAEAVINPGRPQPSAHILLVNSMGRGGGGGGGFGGAAGIAGAVGGLLGALNQGPIGPPPPYYPPPLPPPPPYSPPPYDQGPPDYVTAPPPADTYVSVPPLGTSVSIGRARLPRIRARSAAPPDDPATAWSDPNDVISLLAPPSGGPGPSLLDQPPPGSPLARNPKLLQATLDSYDAKLSASGWADAITVASGVDWIGWTAQQGLTYVPGMKPVNVALSTARGFGGNFAVAANDPNNTWGQAFRIGAFGAQVSAATSLLVPGVGNAAANGLPTVQGVLTNTAKRLITKGVGDFNRAVVQQANQQPSQ